MQFIIDLLRDIFDNQMTYYTYEDSIGVLHFHAVMIDSGEIVYREEDGVYIPPREFCDIEGMALN